MILFMISSCWSSALHPATEILDGSPKSSASSVPSVSKVWDLLFSPTKADQCVKCFDKQYGWLLYITATLIPTNIFCILVMVFQFHATSPEMNAFVFLSVHNMC